MEPRGWLLVTRQGELETALCEFDPSDAFVREVSAVAPTNLLADGWVEAPGAPADVRLVILAPTGSIPGVELHLHEAQNVSVGFVTDIHLTATVTRTEIELSLSSFTPPMRGRALRWRALSREEAEGAPPVGGNADRGRVGTGG